MSSRSREKIALVVFVGLIVLSLCGLGWYLLAGHSWNVAASNLDDTFGSMDGYTAIVYPGTAVEAPAVKTPAEDAKGASAEPLAKNGAKEGDSASPDDASSAGEAAAGGDTAPRGGSTAKDASSADGRLAAPDAPSSGATPAPSDNAAAGLASAEPSDGSLVSKKKTLSVDEAKKGYEDKGATVFSLETVDLAAYDEGVILKKGGHRFGVFSIDAPTSSIVLEKQIAYFKRYQVDFIVVITPDKEYVEGVGGIDIAISTQDEDLFVMGETIDGTFYVDAPAVGSVGAILISPSNVVSAKVLQAP